jgi:hypothetical protein
MIACIHYDLEAYSTNGPKLMGRRCSRLTMREALPERRALWAARSQSMRSNRLLKLGILKLASVGPGFKPVAALQAPLGVPP